MEQYSDDEYIEDADEFVDDFIEQENYDRQNMNGFDEMDNGIVSDMERAKQKYLIARQKLSMGSYQQQMQTQQMP